MAAEQPPLVLWDLSAREVFAILDGVAQRRRDEHDARMEQAWLTARLTAYAPAKSDRFMKLDKLLLGKPEKRRKPKQHWKTQEALMASW